MYACVILQGSPNLVPVTTDLPEGHNISGGIYLPFVQDVGLPVNYIFFLAQEFYICLHYAVQIGFNIFTRNRTARSHAGKDPSSDNVQSKQAQLQQRSRFYVSVHSSVKVGVQIKAEVSNLIKRADGTGHIISIFPFQTDLIELYPLPGLYLEGKFTVDAHDKEKSSGNAPNIRIKAHLYP